MAWMDSFTACLKKNNHMNSMALIAGISSISQTLRLSTLRQHLTRPGGLRQPSKTDWKPSVLGFVLLGLLSMISPSYASEEIKIIRVSDYQQEEQLRLNSESHFNLPEAVINAIDHEIPLTFTTEIVLSEQNTLFGIEFERTRASIKYQTRLYTTGVDHRYALYNSRNHKLQNFQTLEAALMTLGTLDGFPIIPLSELHPTQRYMLKIRISLDHWALPAPLLLESLLTSHWQLSSDWYEVSIQTPGSWL
jgi:hypothetical protein